MQRSHLVSIPSAVLVSPLHVQLRAAVGILTQPVALMAHWKPSCLSAWCSLHCPYFHSSTALFTCIRILLSVLCHCAALQGCGGELVSDNNKAAAAPAADDCCASSHDSHCCMSCQCHYPCCVHACAAACRALEAHNSIQNKLAPEPVSWQFFVDCDTEWNHGCIGGHAAQSLVFAQYWVQYNRVRHASALTPLPPAVAHDLGLLTQLGSWLYVFALVCACVCV